MPHGVWHICGLDFLFGLLNDVRFRGLVFIARVSIITTIVAVFNIAATIIAFLSAITRGFTDIELVDGFLNIGLFAKCNFTGELREFFKHLVPPCFLDFDTFYAINEIYESFFVIVNICDKY